MITSVRFCLSYAILNAILLPTKFVYFNENLHSCHGRRHDVTCSRRMCYITCGHKIIYDMTLSTGQQFHHTIKENMGRKMYYYSVIDSYPASTKVYP